MKIAFMRRSSSRPTCYQVPAQPLPDHPSWPILDRLYPNTMEHTLQVFSGEALVFFSDGKWLYPLFELEDFLANVDWEPPALTVRDKVVGRAAALLLVRLGIRDVRAGIMSRLGRKGLERYGVRYEYDTLVDRIDCRTEEMLVNEFDPERAHAVLKRRANR